MAIENIIPRKAAEASQTTQYTATNAKCTITKFTATNTTGTNVLFSVNLVASGGAAGTSNLVLQTRTIAPGETYTCPELVGQALKSGGFISTLASATGLTISASGFETAI